MKKIRTILLSAILMFSFKAFSQNISAPNSVIVLTSGLSNPTAIATDSVYIYWLEYGSGTVKKILNTGGAVTTLASGLYSLTGIALYDTVIYFGENYGINSSRIKKVSKNGGSVSTIINNLYSISSIALDNDFVYLSDIEGNSIQKVPKSGGSAITLSIQTYAPSGITTDQNDVYWTEFTNPGTIKKVSKSGGTTTTLGNNSNTVGISIDNNYVYWTENVSTNQGKINKVSKNGGSSTPLVTGLNSAWHLCVDDYNVYWVENKTIGAVKQVSKTGGNVTIIADSVNQPVAITSDNLNLYWIERNGGSNGNLKKTNKIISNISKFSNIIPVNYNLHQNYPNPFNPATKIQFDVPKSENVRIIIFDALGREVETLVNEQLSPGTYEATFDGSKYSSGIYFYRLTAGNYSETKRMTLIK